VIRYNAQMPSKYTTYPKYEYHVADTKYQELAQALGLPAATPEQGVESLAKAIENLREKLGIPATFKNCGVSAEEFTAHLDELALNAFDDQCTGVNPRYPLVEELKDILIKAYGK
jgi:acetaldehyde dehydrogenase/alcohol dehydrogenase